MAAPRVIRQALWIRLLIRLFSGVYSAQAVVGMVVLSRHPTSHPSFNWTILAFTLALMVAMPLRLSRLFVRMSGNVLEVRNSLSTRRLSRSEIEMIRTGPAQLHRGGTRSSRRTAYAVLRTGGEVQLEALGSAGPAGDTLDAHVGEIEKWLHPSPDGLLGAPQQGPVRRRSLITVVLGGITIALWLMAFAFYDVAAVQGSVPMMHIGVLLSAAVCLVTVGGILIIAHHRGAFRNL